MSAIHGAIVAGRVHDAGLGDELAQFDQMPRALAVLDLPGTHDGQATIVSRCGPCERSKRMKPTGQNPRLV